MPVTLVGSEWISGFLRFVAKSTKAAIFEVQTTKCVATEKLEFADEVVHTSVVSRTDSANATLDAADSGKVIYVDTDAVVITLPATVVGLSYTFVNIGADAAVKLSISPNALDLIEGVDLTTADNKDLINTKATAKKGDLVEIVGNGTTGWLVKRMHGTWAREA